MTTTVFNAGSTDGQIISQNPTYLTARSGSGLSALTTHTSDPVGQLLSGDYYCYELFLEFDTSTIGDSDTINSVVLACEAFADETNTDFTIEARLMDWGGTITTADWIAGASLGSQTLLATYTTVSGWGTGYHNFTSDGAFVSNINKTGFTRLMLCSDRHRLGTTPSGLERAHVSMSERGGAYVATLTVDYTSAGGTVALDPMGMTGFFGGQMPVLSLRPQLGAAPAVDQALPTALVEMDLGNLVIGAVLDTDVLDTAQLGPLDATFPKDISEFVRAASVTRGAQNELDRMEAGTATIALDNRDGRFTPYLAGPYSPRILPMRRIRIQAMWSSTPYPVFSGFVESWPVEFNDTDQITQVQLVDGFKVLSLEQISGDFVEQGSGARVTAILDAVAWSATDRDIDVGTVTVPAITLVNTAPLEHIQQVAYAEGGRFFMSRDGKATFRDRTSEANIDLSDRTWADDGTGMTYRDVELVFDDSHITNDVRLTRTDGVEQAVSDEGSQSAYGVRSRVETGIQLSDDTQVLSFAEALLTRYAEPRLRLEQLVDNAIKHRYWNRVLGRELTDAVQVIETQTATAQVSLIEGISHDLAGMEWTVTLTVSPTVIDQAGVLDDATYGLLDSTAILAR